MKARAARRLHGRASNGTCKPSRAQSVRAVMQERTHESTHGPQHPQTVVMITIQSEAKEVQQTGIRRTARARPARGRRVGESELAGITDEDRRGLREQMSER